MALLDVKNLTLEIDTANGWINVLDKVSFSINNKEIRALVGESGSGKSLVVKAIVGALPERWRIKADRMMWQGEDLLNMRQDKRRKITREQIAVVYQNPATSLDPSATLGDQIMEAVSSKLLSRGWFWQKQQQREKIAITHLHKVGIRDHKTCMDSYPHQLSDDVCQKFMIALALVSQPKLLIADDPTMAMVPSTKIQILKLFKHLNQTRGLSILFVSHDLLSIFSMADSLTVLYCGQTVETGKMDKILKRPLHPYTQALLDSAPSFSKGLERKTDLPTLEGTIPPLQHLPIGCRLGPRCPRAQKDCVKTPEERRIHEHFYRCHFPIHRPTK
ncbi:ATP-binding cassette domain-containing protein [Alteromonadaceae bacterium M269]|nr:ATP-binding cassette domain-containing protein [Alteromonadaceae bacterium M269]